MYQAYILRSMSGIFARLFTQYCQKNLVDLGLSDNKISKRYVLKRLNLNIKIA